jgi:putative photosynthetic complex assembly protein 2
MVFALGLLTIALCGLSVVSADTSVAAAYMAFSCIICLWGAQEIAFLSGWLTGPRPEPCPADVTGFIRFSHAVQAILYHELSLLICGAMVVALTWNAENQVGLWTYAALYVLRQSAKINLFLGVPVTNAELMPEAVQFLRSYFARKPVSAFFPLSVTLATAVLVIMIQRIVEVAITPSDGVGLTLVSTLFALGVVEHWFMLLPLPAVTLWSWGVRSGLPPENIAMEPNLSAENSAIPQAHRPADVVEATPTGTEPRVGQPQLVVVQGAHNDDVPAKKTTCARQRLEDQFRQTFLQQHPRSELATARIGINNEPATTVNGRTS